MSTLKIQLRKAMLTKTTSMTAVAQVMFDETSFLNEKEKTVIIHHNRGESTSVD